MFGLLQSSPTARRQRRTSPKLSVSTFEDRWMPSTGSVIGSAANYGVLALQNTATTDTNASVDGSVGVASGGSITAGGKAPIVTRNVYESSAGQLVGSIQIGGSVIVDPAQMAQANSDALSGSLTAASQIATQTFWSITVPTTITGNGGVNVINIAGNISSSLILVGSATDVFIINVSGNLSLKGRESLGIIGVTADHVLYNFTGAGTVSTSGRSTVYGTFLAPTSVAKIDGVVYGAVIAGGSLSLQNGAVIHEIDFTGKLTSSAATASLSGQVFDINQPILDAFGNPILDANGNPAYVGIQGATIDLLDGSGNVVMTATTDANGNYALTSIPSGTYSLRVTAPDLTIDSYFGAYAGTVNGSTDGSFVSQSEIGSITLADGDVGVGYRFSLQVSSAPPA